MFGLSPSTGDIVYGLIFDISSESIGVSIIESKQSEKIPFVLFSHRVHMRITKRARSTAEYTRQMREALFSASLIVSRDGLEALTLHNKHGRIHKILVTCSSPWSYTISRNVNYEGDGGMRVTRSLIDDLVQSAESEITSQIEKDQQVGDDKFEIVERATVDVRINDYPIQKPIGLTGSSISLAHITGLIPSEIIQAVYEVQEKIFPGVEVRAHTFLLVLYCVLRDLLPKTDSLCIINITGETTEIGIIEGGTLIESIALEHGSNELIRSIMETQNRTAVEIASLFELLEAGSLTKTVQDEVESHLKMFVTKLKNDLSEQFANRRFPKTAFLLVPAPISSLVVRELTPFMHEHFHNDQSIVTLKPEMIKEFSYHSIADANLGIASRFFHKLNSCGEIESE